MLKKNCAIDVDGSMTYGIQTFGRVVKCIWENRKLGPWAFGRVVDHMPGHPKISKHITSIWENLVDQMLILLAYG